MTAVWQKERLKREGVTYDMWNCVFIKVADAQLYQVTPHSGVRGMAGYAAWKVTPHGRLRRVTAGAAWKVTPHGELCRVEPRCAALLPGGRDTPVGGDPRRG